MDELLWTLGQPGRYQTIICLLLCLSYFPITFNNLNMAFFASDPLFLRCGQINDSRASSGDLFSNSSYEESCMLFDPKTSRKEWCQQRENCTTCNYNSPYVMEHRDWNIVTEFHLVCDRQNLRGLGSSIFFAGMMIGGVLFGHLADTFGRFPVLLVTLYTPSLLGLGIFFCDSFLTFVILRFVMGFFVQGLQNVTVSLLMEYLHSKHRRLAMSGLVLFWGIGVFGLAVIAVTVRHWRWMQLTSSLLTLLSLFYVWLFPESLRWLISKGKQQKARQLIERIAKFNNLSGEIRDAAISLQPCEEENEVTQYNISHLLRDRGFLLRSCILWYIWLALTVGYFGLVLSTGELHGSKYKNFLIGSGIEVGAYLIPFITPGRFGRRKPLFVFFLVGGISCIAAGNVKDELTKTALALVGRFGMSSVYTIIYLISSELYPTVLRTAGLGSCTFWAGIGGILAPQLNLLGTVTSPSLPITIFGSLATIAAFMVLLLPETSTLKIPDTIEEAKEIGWGCCITKTKHTEDTANEQNLETAGFL